MGLLVWVITFVFFLEYCTGVEIEECEYVDKPLSRQYRCHNPINMEDDTDASNKRLRIDCTCPKGSKCDELGGLGSTKEYQCKTCIHQTNRESGLFLEDSDVEDLEKCL